jgi:hypothetical protein
VWPEKESLLEFLGAQLILDGSRERKDKQLARLSQLNQDLVLAAGVAESESVSGESHRHVDRLPGAAVDPE